MYIIDFWILRGTLFCYWCFGARCPLTWFSQSAAYTAGLIAYFFGLGYTPGNVGEHMRSCALSGILTGVRGCYSPHFSVSLFDLTCLQLPGLRICSSITATPVEE
jgi:hypothetical protein